MTEKNDRYGVISTTQDKNRGLSSKNKPGTKIFGMTIPNGPKYLVFNGHRDLNSLTCPNKHLFHLEIQAYNVGENGHLML